MWWIAVALVVGSFCAGCAGVGVQIPGDGKLVIVSYDPSFNTNFLPDGRPESAALREGVRFWNRLGARVFVEGETNEFPNATFHISRDTFSWPGLQTDGVTWPSCGSATIYPNVLKKPEVNAYDFDDFRTAVAHEVGHALGLYHISANDAGAMNPSLGYAAEYPSAEDAAEYKRVWHE